MEIFKPNIPITPENILGYVSQEEIMAKYLGVSVNTKSIFCSPLRSDKHPTCTFTWIDGTLLFRDWARENSLDCFGVVMEKYGVGFLKAQKIIANDFDIVKNISINKPKRKVTYSKGKGRRSKSDIKIKIQAFTDDNIKYLKSYSITYEITKKFKVYSPSHVWINNRLQYVQKNNSNPALAYFFGIDNNNIQKWKIYFYRKEDSRFITNTNRINGWVQIPDRGENLIITKSLKDVMCLDIFNIPAVAMQAESQTPYDYIIEELQSRFDKIVSLYDHDEAGIKRAKTIKELYGIPYYFIKDNKAKDFSDYIKLYGKMESKQLIDKILCS